MAQTMLPSRWRRTCLNLTHIRETPTMLEIILIVVLLLLLLGALPTWGHSRSWGYGPSGVLGLVLVVILVLVLIDII